MSVSEEIDQLGREVAGQEPRKKAAERIFETARELFYSHGIRAVGVDQIVAEAGVTKPTLYRAFSSKDELVAACLDEMGNEHYAELKALIEQSPGDPRRQLRDIVAHYAAMIDRPDFRGCPMTNAGVEFPEPDNPGRRVLERHKSQFRDCIVGIASRLAIADPEGLADGLILVVEGAMATHHCFERPGPSSRMISTADVLIDSYLGKQPGKPRTSRKRG